MENRSYRLIAVLVAILSGTPLAAIADIYKCDGQWTNKPCSGSVEEKLPEPDLIKDPVIEPLDPPEGVQLSNPAPTQPSGFSEPLAPRLELIRNLKKQNKDAMAKGVKGIPSSQIADADRLCQDRSKPFEECKKKCGALSSEIESQTSAQEKDILGDLGGGSPK